MARPKLKDCPFCGMGSPGIWQTTVQWFFHSFKVYCHNLNCGATGGEFETIRKAVKAWNKRI